jgi:hypothetical protein
MMPIPTSFITVQSSKRLLAALLSALLLALPVAAQIEPPPPPPRADQPKRLPDGRLWSEAVLKANYEANLKDLDRMRKILEAVQKELDESKGHVLSIKALKDLEELERLSRRVRDRMRQH